MNEEKFVAKVEMVEALIHIDPTLTMIYELRKLAETSHSQFSLCRETISIGVKMLTAAHHSPQSYTHMRDVIHRAAGWPFPESWATV